MIKMKNFLVSHFPQIATYATIIVIFTQNVLFDREGACTCQDQTVHCNVYIIMPIFIIFLLLLWNDKDFNGTWRACCCMKKRKICNKICYLLVQMVKASVISLLWVVSVLFDGDWYACCQNGLPKEKTQIPCKTNRTIEEQAIVDNLKNESKVNGLYVLLGLLLLIFCFSLLKWCDFWRKCYMDGDGLYELIIIKEEENIVNQILKERAKEALRKKVDVILDRNDRNEYMDYYKPAQKVIDQLWPEGNQVGLSQN
ncbi:uncharacterized protein LOC116736547 [Xiphophorus hellerii]|uniref:uncharacterized protein LOC116736547 n=1 Tax=Xiphophorus hellerii TaxID=8084 RepID=UPI0013B3E26D|nr:uncharacterized protein LOC116736547 [Xiphophorus hellerii]